MNQARATDHLSIGEVLSLVQEDFPDVTISKIRFLESQGLIAPERTASGYRKFFEADIDRLRWILRQQRDHFLPLKVIKRMLDQGVDVAEDAQGQATLFEGDDTVEGAAPRAAETDAGSERSRSAAHPAVQAARNARPAGPSATDPAAAGVHRAGAAATARSGPDDDGVAGRPGADPASGSMPRSSDVEGSDLEGSDVEGSDVQGADDEGTTGTGSPKAAAAPARSPDRGPAGGGRPLATPADVVAALQEHPPGARRRSDAGTGRGAGPDGDAPVPDGAARHVPSLFARGASGGRLSRAELIEATGIDEALLDELVRFGLIVAVPLGADPTYDEDAVDVARIGRRCAELGIDPRHLRMYKVSAEREAGVLEQLVAPLVRQRNPDARRLATDRADEIAAMGAELHATLLRRHLGPVVAP